MFIQDFIPTGDVIDLDADRLSSQADLDRLAQLRRKLPVPCERVARAALKSFMRRRRAVSLRLGSIDRRHVSRSASIKLSSRLPIASTGAHALVSAARKQSTPLSSRPPIVARLF